MQMSRYQRVWAGVRHITAPWKRSAVLSKDFIKDHESAVAEIAFMVFDAVENGHTVDPHPTIAAYKADWSRSGVMSKDFVNELVYGLHLAIETGNLAAQDKSPDWLK